MSLNDLKLQESELNNLRNSITKLESSLSSRFLNFNFLIQNKINKIRTKIFLLDKIQETNVMNYLEENDPEYLALTHRSFDLLSHNKVEFKVYEELGRVFETHATLMRGSLHPNGFVYTDTSDTNFDPTNIEVGVFPLEYKGIINYLGELDLKISKTGYEIIGGRMPQNFNGSIDENGYITIKTDQTEWQPVGTFFINKMIGDIFVDEHEKRTLFLENIDLIKARIKEFREKLIIPTQSL